MIAPQAKSRAPRAKVGVETKPASTADGPAERTPAPSAWTSMGPVIRGSRPMIVTPDLALRVGMILGDLYGDTEGEVGCDVDVADAPDPGRTEPRHGPRDAARDRKTSETPKSRSPNKNYIATPGCARARRIAPRPGGIGW